MKGGESQWEGRLRIPRRSLGVREFENGLRIRTSTSLLCEDTGGDVWRGAMALAKYLEEDEPASFVGKRVIELGGGTGLLGLSLALSGAQEVCITDKENTVPLVQKNISENEALLAAKGANARGAVLDWFDATLGESVVKGCPYDLIVVSDVFYEEEIVEPFVQTLRRLFCLSASRRAISDIRGGTGAAPGAGAGAGGGGRGRGGEGGAGGDVFPDMLLCASHRTERIERLFHEAMREWFVVSEITAECSFKRMLDLDMVSIFRISVRSGMSADELGAGLSQAAGEALAEQAGVGSGAVSRVGSGVGSGVRSGSGEHVEAGVHGAASQDPTQTLGRKGTPNLGGELRSGNHSLPPALQHLTLHSGECASGDASNALYEDREVREIGELPGVGGVELDVEKAASEEVGGDVRRERGWGAPRGVGAVTLKKAGSEEGGGGVRREEKGGGVRREGNDVDLEELD